VGNQRSWLAWTTAAAAAGPRPEHMPRSPRHSTMSCFMQRGVKTALLCALGARPTYACGVAASDPLLATNHTRCKQTTS
jgi:hypothetical protein